MYIHHNSLFNIIIISVEKNTKALFALSWQQTNLSLEIKAIPPEVLIIPLRPLHCS